METVIFEDNSGLVHDDGCAYAVMDEGVWQNPVIGQVYYTGDGNSVVGCYVLPDTAMTTDGVEDTGLGALIMVAVLVAVRFYQWVIGE